MAAKKALKSSSQVKQWLTAFYSNLRGVLSLSERELHDMIQLEEDSDFEFFTNEVLKGIRQCKETYLKSFKAPQESNLLAMTILIEEAAEIVCDNIAGCCAQCPFCKEQCERTDKDHDGDHFCKLHRPQCLRSCQFKHSKEMVLDICTVSVGTDGAFESNATNNEPVPFKQYRDIYPDWEIINEERTIAPYWKWFIAQYKEYIMVLFNYKLAQLSEDWKHLTPEDAESDVKKRYNLK